MLVETSHVPTDVRQLLPPLDYHLPGFIFLGIGFALTGRIPVDQLNPAKQLLPSIHNLRIVPIEGELPVHIQHYVIVIGHDCVSTDIDGEQCGQCLDLIHGPLLAVLVAVRSRTVLAAQKGTVHAAVIRGISDVDQVFSKLVLRFFSIIEL